jgi:hypothetical protein
MSVIALDGQLFLDLKVDDQDLPVAGVDFLDQITMLQDVSSGIPTLTLTVNDSEGIFSDLHPLSDANKFSITIGKDKDELSSNRPYEFRLFSWKAIQYSRGLKYVIHAVLDNYKFIKKIKTKAYKGTSYKVIKEIVEDCGLDFVGDSSGDPCSDEQTWINVCDPVAIFIKKITQHSYSENGVMLACASFNGDFIYKNINNAFSESTQPYASFDSDLDSKKTDNTTTSPATTSNPSSIGGTDFSSSPDKYTMREYTTSSSSGFLNSWVNYGYKMIEDLMSGSNEEYSGVSIPSADGAASINTEISDQIEIARRDYAPIDCGNTYPKYWKAYHRNLRMLGLFSQKSTFLVDTVTNLQPLDPIDLKFYNLSTGKPNGYSGRYIVGAHKIVIKGTKYAELFEVYKMTVPKTSSSSTEADNSSNITNAPSDNSSSQKLPKLADSPPPQGSAFSGTKTSSGGIAVNDMEPLVSGDKPVSDNQLIQPKEVNTLPLASDVLKSNKTSSTTNTSQVSQSSSIIAVKNLGELPNI